MVTNKAKSRAAATLGRAKTAAKTETARENGRKGGRKLDPWEVEEVSTDRDTGRCYRVLLARGVRESLEVYLDRTYHTDRHGKVTPWEPDENTTPLALFCWKQAHCKEDVEANHRDFLEDVIAREAVVRELHDPLGLLVDVDRKAIHDWVDIIDTRN